MVSIDCDMRLSQARAARACKAEALPWSEHGRNSAMERRFVKVEKGLGPEGRVAIVRFDRNDNINALSRQAMRELRDVPADFEDDLGTSVVILTGSAKAFSAGFDLKDPESTHREDLPIGERIQRQRLGPKMCKAWQDMDQ